MKFLIGSSYFDRGKGGHDFRLAMANMWYFNTVNAGASRMVIIAEGGSKPPTFAGVDYINLTGDLGHCHDLIEGRKPHEFSSWSAHMIALAMIAYDDEADFIYKEEDCFPFRDWVGQMYRDLGDGMMVFGQKHESPPWMPCSQSLFLVRHAFIPRFVSTYLAMGGERDPRNLGEHKFVKIEERFNITGMPKRIRRLSFGVDRCRPIPWDAPVFYFQQPTVGELEEARTRNLL